MDYDIFIYLNGWFINHPKNLKSIGLDTLKNKKNHWIVLFFKWIQNKTVLFFKWIQNKTQPIEFQKKKKESERN